MTYALLELNVLLQGSPHAITPAAVSSTTVVTGAVSKAGLGKAITTAPISATTTVTFHPPDVYATTVVTGAIRVPGFQQITGSVTSTTTVSGSISFLPPSTGGYQSQRVEGFAHLMGFPL